MFAVSEEADLASPTVTQHSTPHSTPHQTGRKPLSASSRCAESDMGFDKLSHQRTTSDFQQLLAYALKSLARREHSSVELRRKLNGYVDRSTGRSDSHSGSHSDSHLDRHAGTADDHISRVIEALILDGSLSDERFASEFVRSRIRKGYGPIRIRMDLLERGVPDRLAEDELTRSTEFWQQQAAEVCQRKFGDRQNEQFLDVLPQAKSASDALEEFDEASPEEARQLMLDRKEVAQRRWNRCARFLSQRGFPADLIYRTLDGRLLD